MPTRIATTKAAHTVAPDSEAFRAFMSQWPTGVTVVTTEEQGRATGCTVNAVMSVSLDPPLLVVALNSASGTLRAIRRRGRFAVNVLAAHQRDLCRRFATGRPRDRFGDVAHEWHLGVPLLDGAAAATVCRIYDAYECGDHIMLAGTPQWHTTDDDAAPLLFYRKGYCHLAGGGDAAGALR